MGLRRRTVRRTCRYPHKRQYTKADARRAAEAMRRQNMWMRHYRCPSGGHWHLTSRRFNRKG